MKNEENSNEYIVPIYVEGVYNGTGFIIEDYLITAAHVVKDDPQNILFIYKNKRIKPGKWVRHEYSDYVDGYAIMNDSIKTDLAIYHIPEVYGIHSNLSLSLHGALDCSCLYIGYNQDEKGIVIKEKYKDIHIVQEVAVGDDNNPTIEKINCYTSDKSILKKGNSGGPIFLNEKIVGMLYASKKYGDEDRFIQSIYIQIILDKLKYNSRQQ